MSKPIYYYVLRDSENYEMGILITKLDIVELIEYINEVQTIEDYSVKDLTELLDEKEIDYTYIDRGNFEKVVLK